MVLSSEWSQVEVIDLTNDGTNLSGLGFIIVGGRSTGVRFKRLILRCFMFSEQIT